jgi:hypothetical protein
MTRHLTIPLTQLADSAPNFSRIGQCVDCQFGMQLRPDRPLIPRSRAFSSHAFTSHATHWYSGISRAIDLRISVIEHAAYARRVGYV